jgi:hypothetical protein
MHYLIEERLLPVCQLARVALATVLPDGQYMLEANGSLSHLGWVVAWPASLQY